MALEHYTTKFALASSLFLSFACGGDDGDTGAGTDATSTGVTSSPTTNETMSTTNSTTPGTSEGTTAPGTTDGGESTAGTDTGATSVSPDGSGSAGSSSSGGGAGACDPVADEPGCLTCIKNSCCDELEACLADADCACIHECVEAGFPKVNPQQCAGGCPGANLGDPTSPEAQFDACAAQMCFMNGMCP